jgi:ribosomal protein L32
MQYTKISVSKRKVRRYSFRLKILLYCNLDLKDGSVSVLHARLRNECSSLNSDLFKSKLVPSASCSCGYKNECSEHFLLYCNKFNLLRNNILSELNMLYLVSKRKVRRYSFRLKILLYCNLDLKDGSVGSWRRFRSRVFHNLIVLGK